MTKEETSMDMSFYLKKVFENVTVKECSHQEQGNLVKLQEKVMH
jgi:hypothetical protein